ncbi:MAG: type II secretion system minor pseudopilin GspH [Pseudomarimonas sp.]
MRDGGRNRRRQSHGFTLIEVLVVVIIIGVVAGAATLAITGSGSRELENAARRAEVRIRLACERAVFSGQDLGFSLREGVLSFGYLLPDRWLRVADTPDEALRERVLGEAIAVTISRDGLPLFTDTDDDLSKPQFVCYSSGELTPFELTLAREGVSEQWRLLARLDGELELERVDPQ